MSTNGKSQHVSIDVKELPQPTKCMHCSRTFPVAVPIVGAPKDREYIQLTGQLAQHLMEKHPLMAKKAVEQQLQIGIGVSALMCLANYESADAGLVSWRDRVRFQIHEFSTKNRISDQTIEEKVRALFPDDSHVSSMPEVIALVKEMRDILEERGAFSPQAMPVSSVVLPH